MASDSRHDGLLTPAPYGKACLSCARAKCKCFYRPEGSLCERCHRLGKHCEPGAAHRKRRAPSPQHSRDPPAPPPPLVPASRLEDKLDDLVTLLRCQVEKQAQVSQPTPQLTLGTTPSSSGITTNPATTERHPEMLVDTVHNTVQLLRPSSPSPLRSPIMEDISLHHIPEAVADEQLATFCRAFLPIFPFVHIGATMKSCELRNVKPFLWLNIMALATKSVSQQFAMEETIWQIISQRIVVQHFANIDLLLGVVCFASWSHYFKKDKPYMTMLAQIAVSLACELGINGDSSRGFSFERKWDDEIIFHYNSSIAQTTQRSSAESTGRSAHFSTELSIRESILRGGPDRLPGVDVQRLRELDSVLTAIEGWLDVFTHMPLVDAIGIHVDNFTQFLHCIVVLFKLSVLEEPGWDLEEVKRRLDVFNVLDTTYQLVESITIVTGMVDAEGPRSGLFFKAKHLWRAIKALLVAEYSESMVTSNLHGCQKEGGANEAATVAEDISMDNFLFNLADEPWLSDISNYDWGAAEGTFETPPFTE
ncbi:putative Zn(2)-C6 fungal-type domain-containing protein [Seiridium cardinale]